MCVANTAMHIYTYSVQLRMGVILAFCIILSYLILFSPYIIVSYTFRFLYILCYMLSYIISCFSYIIVSYLILPHCLEGGLWCYRAITFPAPALSAECCDWAERSKFTSSRLAASWDAFYFESQRFDLDTPRVPNRSPHPNFEI